MISFALSLIGSIHLIFIIDKTSIIWICIICGTSIECINLPLTSDAYTGLDSKQLPEAGVGIKVIATVIATVTQGLQPTIANGLKGYHAGYLVSTIVIALIFIPSLFLTYKKAK
ncbi:hypothetical protein BLHB2_11560 [Bacillus licheniformis]|jgi:hypothetical protein|nr:hypothetical protein CHCC20369_4063 [Bacillus licheniformis]GBC65335.1 hypothetical protein BLHB2_11560 [Bacillus licheniformis]